MDTDRILPSKQREPKMFSNSVSEVVKLNANELSYSEYVRPQKPLFSILKTQLHFFVKGTYHIGGVGGGSMMH